MTTLHLRKSIGRSPLRLGFLLIPLVIACFGLLPAARAVTPAPDGAYFNYNTAEGQGALFHLTTGTDNTANGAFALFTNTIGFQNTAIGTNALASNTTGSFNTAVGDVALFSNTTGDGNTATGLLALGANTTGQANTANGAFALNQITDGFNNTANGAFALFSISMGNSNTATGAEALFSNTGSNNIALGSFAGYNLTTGSNNIDIGNIGAAGQANTIRIGNAVATLYPDGTTHPAQTATYIAGIRGATVASGVTVIIGTDGHLGTIVSSSRFKAEIKPLGKWADGRR